MRWLTWQKGRQVANYAKMMLFDSSFFDCYLLYYPPDSHLPEHVDFVPGHRHYRFNVILRTPKKGGDLKCSESYINTKRIKFFRSDRPHSMTPIDKGIRVVLSFGWIIKDSP